MKGKTEKKRILLISIITVLPVAAISVAVYAAFVRNSDTAANIFSSATSLDAWGCSVTDETERVPAATTAVPEEMVGA